MHRTKMKEITISCDGIYCGNCRFKHSYEQILPQGHKYLWEERIYCGLYSHGMGVLENSNDPIRRVGQCLEEFGE